MTKTLLITDIGELITLAPLVRERRYTSISKADLGSLSQAWLLIENTKVKAYGQGQAPRLPAGAESFSAQGALITPGLIDCHTHPLFAGDRTHEFAARLEGLSYQDIAKQGGGIKYTIEASSAASDDELLAKTRNHLKTLLRWGVTTLETKSGYGQTPEEEIRHLRLLQCLRAEGPQHLSITCLGLHDIPRNGPPLRDFVQAMTNQLLPVVAKEQLADWVDGFVENGYFSVEDARPFFEKAKSLGLRIRLHADEFQDSGAAKAAAEWGAASADHLQKASPAGIAAMAAAGTVAVLLPGTSFYTKLPYTQAAAFRQAACPIAVASDFNPGSCFLPNLPLAASMAALYAGLSPAEACVGVTWNAARALRLEDRKGALEVGFDADFVWHRHQTLAQWIADCGQTQPAKVFIAGKIA